MCLQYIYRLYYHIYIYVSNALSIDMRPNNNNNKTAESPLLYRYTWGKRVGMCRTCVLGIATIYNIIYM